MTDKTESPRKSAPGKAGADKRADALRENLKKRKAQQSARLHSQQDAGQDSGIRPMENKNDPERS